MGTLIILVGLPGSGKSTYAKQLCYLDPEKVYLSSDKIREELYGDESIQGDANKVFRLLHHRVKENLSLGKDVIYDATNVNRKSRKGIIEEVKNLATYIEAHIVWAPYEVCIQRDTQRSRHVGKEVIDKFIRRWETPFYDEGINLVKVICTDSEFNSFEYTKKLVKDMDIPHDNPHHSLGVGDHCVEAYNYAVKHFTNDLVSIACMYHDIGKPIAKFFKYGETVAHYYNHDNIGGYLAFGLDSYDSAILLCISWLISNHMQPYFNSNYYKSLKDTDWGKRLDELHEADLNAH